MAGEDEGEAAGTRDVHRLVDMVVEEVSLVDRAANQRRFLLVKRRSEMADEETAAEDTTEADNDDQAPAGAESPAGTGTPVGPGPEAMVAALEALTGLAEVLATAGAEKAGPPKKGPGGGAAADDDEEPTDDEESDDARDDDGEDDDAGGGGKRPPRSKAGPPVAALLGQVRAALARLQAAVTSTEKRAPAATASTDLGGKLDQLGAALTRIEGQFKDHATRLERVEKSVGLPASRPPDGKPAGNDDGDVSWPLDMNAPMDREHVDKAVSFHDSI